MLNRSYAYNLCKHMAHYTAVAKLNVLESGFYAQVILFVCVFFAV